MAGLATWWLDGGGKRSQDNVVSTQWKTTTHSFDADGCLQGGCRELLRTPPMGLSVATLLVDPQVDDATAQWADCLSSVARCVESQKHRKPGEGLRECVRQSSCPAACRERFRQRAEPISDADGLWALFEEIFVREGGACVPAG